MVLRGNEHVNGYHYSISEDLKGHEYISYQVIQKMI